jgi:uncharacterized membrane protein
MLTRLNKMSDRNFVAGLVAVVLAVLLIGGYAGIKAVQNNQRANACAEQGGTAYGHDNWLCVK